MTISISFAVKVYGEKKKCYGEKEMCDKNGHMGREQIVKDFLISRNVGFIEALFHTIESHNQFEAGNDNQIFISDKFFISTWRMKLKRSMQ